MVVVAFVLIGLPFLIWVLSLISGFRTYPVNRGIGAGLIAYCGAVALAGLIDLGSSTYFLERYLLDIPNTLPEILPQVLLILLLIAAAIVDRRTASRILIAIVLALAVIWTLALQDIDASNWAH